MKILALLFISLVSASAAEIGIGAKPVEGAEVIFDGTREALTTEKIVMHIRPIKRAQNRMNHT